MSAARWLPALGVTLVAALFTWWNRGERIVVDVGLVHFYRAPLAVVVFLAFLAGMLSMLLLSLRHDRRVRDELRARGLLEPAPARAAAPAASAWGVARGPAPRAEEPAAAYPRLDGEDRGGDGRTAGYSGHDGLSGGADRTAVYPRLDEARGDDGRTVPYSRRDEDPAA